MNYIFLTPRFKSELISKYLSSSSYYGEFNFSKFLQNSFNNNSRGILYNKICEFPLRIKIWSPKLILYLEELDNESGFKVISIKDNSIEKFNQMLRHLKVLKGDWTFALMNSDVKSLGNYEYLRNEEAFNEKIDEFNEYSKYWINHDLITKKREEKAKLESTMSISKYDNMNINFDKQEINIHVVKNQYKYSEKDKVILSEYIEYSRDEFCVLGEVIEVNSNLIKIFIEDKKLLSEIYDKNILKKGYIRINDAGTMIMLKRQKIALKKLFNRETANERLKDFIPEIENASTLNDIQSEDYSNEVYLNKMNDSQKKAINGSINCDDIFLIQGPPGTGKTTVICEIIKKLITQNKNILISSQNHLAVDNVLQKIGDDENIRAIRIGGEDKIELGCEKYILKNRVIDIQNKIKDSLLNFDKKKLEVSQEFNELKVVVDKYKIVREDFFLLNNLVINFKTEINELKKINNDLQNMYDKEKSIDNAISKFDMDLEKDIKCIEEINLILKSYKREGVDV